MIQDTSSDMRSGRPDRLTDSSRLDVAGAGHNDHCHRMRCSSCRCATCLFPGMVCARLDRDRQRTRARRGAGSGAPGTTHRRVVSKRGRCRRPRARRLSLGSVPWRVAMSRPPRACTTSSAKACGAFAYCSSWTTSHSPSPASTTSTTRKVSIRKSKAAACTQTAGPRGPATAAQVPPNWRPRCKAWTARRNSPISSSA